jgi:hypothetical protein
LKLATAVGPEFEPAAVPLVRRFANQADWMCSDACISKHATDASHPTSKRRKMSDHRKLEQIAGSIDERDRMPLCTDKHFVENQSEAHCIAFAYFLYSRPRAQ